MTLSGANSHDPDGDSLSFSWELTSKPQDSQAVLSNANAESASFTADKQGNFMAQLTVSDEEMSATDRVQVQAVSGTPDNGTSNGERSTTDLMETAHSFPASAVEDVRTIDVVLPGADRSTQVTVEIVNGQAIYQGDINLGPVDQLVNGQGVAVGKKPSSNNNLWNQKTVHYSIKQNDFTAKEIQRIDRSIRYFERNSPLNWVKRSKFANPPNNYVEFADQASGCWSKAGQTGGKQRINISASDGCVWPGIIIHEMGHAVGLYHEHTRCDRNKYVKINWNNIQKGEKHNFKKNCSGAADIGEYDFSSIMHYGRKLFSKNNKKTIEVLDKWSFKTSNIGTDRLSKGDKNTLIEIYARTKPPKIEIVKPQDGATFKVGNVVSFEAQFNAPAGMHSIKWITDGDYAGAGSTLGTSKKTSAGLLCQGQHNITATIRDNSGRTASDQISITMENVQPSISFKDPPSTQNITQGSRLALTAVAQDETCRGGADQGQIVWLVNGSIAGNPGQHLFYRINASPNSTVDVRARYSDGSATATTKPLTFTVTSPPQGNQPPQAQIIKPSPLNGDWQTLILPTLEARAADPDGSISKYEWAVTGPTEGGGHKTINFTGKKVDNNTELWSKSGYGFWPGEFTFKLTVTDNDGKQTTKTLRMRIIPPG